MNRFLVPLLVAATVLATSGCYAHLRAQPASGYVVYESPPPPRVVVRPAVPYAGAIWVAGHWQWNGAQWMWAEGYWEQPRAGYVYVQPRWQRQGRGYVYVGGGWQGRGQVHVQGRGRVQQPRGRVRARSNVHVAPPRGSVEVRGGGRGTVEVR
jgi:hypothetical protein